MHTHARPLTSAPPLGCYTIQNFRYYTVSTQSDLICIQFRLSSIVYGVRATFIDTLNRWMSIWLHFQLVSNRSKWSCIHRMREFTCVLIYFISCSLCFGSIRLRIHAALAEAVSSHICADFQRFRRWCHPFWPTVHTHFRINACFHFIKLL